MLHLFLEHLGGNQRDPFLIIRKNDESLTSRKAEQIPDRFRDHQLASFVDRYGSPYVFSFLRGDDGLLTIDGCCFDQGIKRNPIGIRKALAACSLVAAQRYTPLSATDSLA